MPRHPSKPATEALTLTPIAITRSCFQDKFGVPRQPGLTRHARAELIIQPPFDREDAFRGLETASHLWLTFQFHEAVRADWRPVVRPPRLGGNRKMGVFASRSPFRPNSLGLSVVRNEGLVRKDGQLILRISDHDLIEGTPILDIKPYLPFADSVPEATLGWADSAPVERLPVIFMPEADLQRAHLYWISNPTCHSPIQFLKRHWAGQTRHPRKNSTWFFCRKRRPRLASCHPKSIRNCER